MLREAELAEVVGEELSGIAAGHRCKSGALVEPPLASGGAA
jgi:hypothetical protein